MPLKMKHIKLAGCVEINVHNVSRVFHFRLYVIKVGICEIISQSIKSFCYFFQQGPGLTAILVTV